MSLQRARSVEEYIERIRQAVFEVGDLRECLEFELEDLVKFPAFLDPLEEGIRSVYDNMFKGTYSFGREDLAFMDVADRHAEEIPFHLLLKHINEPHRKGLDVPTDED